MDFHPPAGRQVPPRPRAPGRRRWLSRSSGTFDPKTGSPGRTALGPIEKVEAVDDLTVRFRMSSSYADLPVTLGATFGRILPADRPDKIVSEPSGTGPFRLVEFKPGERTRMVRFADYWDKPMHPYAFRRPRSA